VLNEVIVVREGDEAPRFAATIQDGSRVALEEILEQGPLVLYFYPKDFTPG
jgi:peroxiredoxin Q/BCP